MAEVIPFGQPILVGHHSEKRDRAYRGRIDGKFRKGFELYEKSKDLNSRAEAMINNAAIFSDDPAAVEKITSRLEQLEKRQELMKAVNKIVRAKKRDDEKALTALLDLGFEEPFAKELMFGRRFCHELGYQRYELTNNGANIRRLKERAEKVEKRQGTETTEEIIHGVTIEFNPGENRVRMFFQSRVSHDLFNELRRCGFRKAPSLGDYAFSAFYNNRSVYYSRIIAGKIDQGDAR
jgi:hypothetical protein